MKIIFVYTGEEYLGIEYLSAVLKNNGHQTRLVYDPRLFNDHYSYSPFLERIFSFRKKLIAEIVQPDTDLIAFSVNSPEYKWALELAASLKERSNIPIVFGGHHPTCCPEEVISHDFIDFVIQGEGEYALLDLVRHLERKAGKDEIKNLYYKTDDGNIHNIGLRPFIEDLDELPFPDKELFYSKMSFLSQNYTIMASRGCPYSCSYCHNGYLKKIYNGKGKYVRRRSIENVVKELKERKKIYKMKGVMFQDEIFTLDFEWLKEFSARYKKEIDLPYACYIHPNIVDSKTVALLRSSGCVSVNMGIESIDEKVREELLHRTIPQSQILDALMLLMRNGIYCRAYFLIGLPGQKDKDLIDLARFCNEFRFGLPLVFWLHYFPNTEIAKTTPKNGGEHKWRGYALGGDSFDISLSKLGFLIQLTTFLRKDTIEFIIRKRIYKFFPAHHHFFYLKIIQFLFRFRNIFLGVRKNTRVPSIASLPIVQKYKYFMKVRILQLTGYVIKQKRIEEINC